MGDRGSDGFLLVFDNPRGIDEPLAQFVAIKDLNMMAFGNVVVILSHAASKKIQNLSRFRWPLSQLLSFHIRLGHLDCCLRVLKCLSLYQSHCHELKNDEQPPIE